MGVDMAPAQSNKLRWGEMEEDEGEDLEFLLPRRQEIGPDENGVKKVVEYKFNDEGNKVKITTTTRIRKLASARLSKRAVERRSWPKFGDAVHEDVGSRLTMVSTEEIILERPRAPVVLQPLIPNCEEASPLPKVVESVQVPFRHAWNAPCVGGSNHGDQLFAKGVLCLGQSGSIPLVQHLGGLMPQVHQARHKLLHSAKLTSSKVLTQLRFMSSRCQATQQCASEGPPLSIACWVFDSISKYRRVKHALIDAYRKPHGYAKPTSHRGSISCPQCSPRANTCVRFRLRPLLTLALHQRVA
ncbi:hypothetical protein TEA_024061 [Camellia sinensis var. sinensis]|uniref:Eukaryotic translation initiation factor 3 subunit G N-terminal domain-containing protein n=1 Tax=Camellia sinensis var. sinensis TaxID=542762 RepID=A0A4S4ED57_CAMSN|nr:hypothetical protein TEA_024061 [Camellia sinensis var. sinensis]